MSFLDLDEWVLEVTRRVDYVYGPLVDVKEYPEGVDVVLVEGAVCTEEHVEMARLIRSRTRHVVSFGDCAVTSNVVGLRNPLGGPEVVLHRAYVELADLNPGVPVCPGILPPLLARALPLHQVIQVDHFVPGCPPCPERIRTFLESLLDGGPGLSGRLLKFG
jgi:NAD-reducing hydrogenase small subunit